MQFDVRYEMSAVGNREYLSVYSFKGGNENNPSLASMLRAILHPNKEFSFSCLLSNDNEYKALRDHLLALHWIEPCKGWWRVTSYFSDPIPF